MRESTVALRSGRMIRRCMSTPIAAPMAMHVIIADVPRPAGAVAQVVVRVGDHQPHRPLGEVDDTRAAVDQDDALRGEGIEAARS